MPDWGREASHLELWPALQDELRFFNHILADHGRVIRGMLDLGEDALIREGDRFTARFTALTGVGDQAVRGVWDGGPAPVAEVAALVEEFVAFKAELLRLLELCQVQAIYPPALIAHARREALWHLGMLQRAQGRPAPRRRDLDLPDGELPALLVPRRLLGRVAVNLNVAALEYALFWVKDHEEHAALLAQHTRPLGQRRLHHTLLAWEKGLHELHRQGVALLDHLRRSEERRHLPPQLEPAVRQYAGLVSTVMVRFQNYLAELVEDLRHCRVPAGQTNFWPSLAHHMRQEADYLLDALLRVKAAADGRPPGEGYAYSTIEE
jgi:hypothetical protein